MRWLRKTTLGLTVAVSLGPGTAGALTLGFDCITNNLAGDCALGESQLSVTVSDPGPGGVVFTFRNAGPLVSSITDIYFDDSDAGALLKISVIVDSPPLVDFETNASPTDLPGGNNAAPPFAATKGFTADSESPVQPKGVNPGEEVVIIFLLKAGKSFSDVLSTLEDGTLRIGIHVQGFGTEGSESFVNVPEPRALGLVGLGLLGIGARARGGLGRGRHPVARGHPAPVPTP